MATPSEKLEEHFYALLRALPDEKLEDWVPADETMLDRLIEYARKKNKQGRRPLNKQKVLKYREKLLDHMDQSEEDLLDLAVKY